MQARALQASFWKEVASERLPYLRRLNTNEGLGYSVFAFGRRRNVQTGAHVSAPTENEAQSGASLFTPAPSVFRFKYLLFFETKCGIIGDVVGVDQNAVDCLLLGFIRLAGLDILVGLFDRKFSETDDGLTRSCFGEGLILRIRGNHW
jgi:hypothetical protein